MDEKFKKDFKPKPGHAMPLTRRELLAQGLISAAGTMLAPSALKYLISPELAQAQTAPLTCPTLGAASGFIPFLSIDCVGGATLAGNIAVGSQQTGSLVPLTSYNALGITYTPASTANAYDTRFGAPFHIGPSPADSTRPISRLFEGLVATIPTSAQANTRIVSICHTSQDDSFDNEINPGIALTQAGLRGTVVQNGFGTKNTLTGDSSAPSLINTAYRPFYAANVNAVTNALSYGTTLAAFPAVYREKLANAISNLSLSQANRFSQLTLGEQYQAMVDCGLITNKNFATVSPNVDPRTNAAMRTAYNITSDTQNDLNTTRAAIVYNSLMGNSGPGALEVGSCDYHDAERRLDDPNHGDVHDREIGVEIGRIIHAASLLNKPVFIAVYSDGACGPNLNERIWVSDSGTKGLAFMVVYRPTGAPTVRKPQIGWFDNSQVVSGTPFFANSPKFVSYIMIANYLNVCGQIGMFPSLAPAGFGTSSSNIDSILGFG